jgi:hypothetical protein
VRSQFGYSSDVIDPHIQTNPGASSKQDTWPAIDFDFSALEYSTIYDEMDSTILVNDGMQISNQYPLDFVVPNTGTTMFQCNPYSISACEESIDDLSTNLGILESINPDTCSDEVNSGKLGIVNRIVILKQC